MTIDLHGLNETKATSRMLLILYDFENNDFESELIIITGKGTRTIQIVVENLLMEEGFYFTYDKYNKGKIIVYKN